LFSQGGVAVMADGDVQVIVDAGPFGEGSAGHSHADTLSVIARCGDEEVLVDSGTYTYAAGGGSRDWFRGTSAHNTVRIDGREQGIAAGPFRWGSRPLVSLRQWLTCDEWDFLDAECGYADFVHRRRVFFLKPDLLLVLDELAGPPGEHTLEQFWHFGEPVACINPRLFRAGAGSYFAVPPGVGIDIGEGGEHGWRSPAYGVRVASPVLRVHRRGTLPATFRAVLDFRGSPEGGLSTGFDGVCTYRRGPRTWAFRYGQAGPPEWSCAAMESGPSGFDLPESAC
jgi:hypothetical protein